MYIIFSTIRLPCQYSKKEPTHQKVVKPKRHVANPKDIIHINLVRNMAGIIVKESIYRSSTCYENIVYVNLEMAATRDMTRNEMVCRLIKY